MKRARVERQLRWLERPWPWLMVGAFACVTALSIGLLVESGLLERVDRELFARSLHGYTFLGLVSGIFALLSLSFVLAYSLRKRWWQEHFPLVRSTMMTWLWSHVTLGIAALALASFHAGYGLIGLRFGTGKVAFVLLFLIALSGLVWRIVYQIVPPMAAPRIGNYSEEGSQRRADEQQTEIDKLVAGRSQNLHALKDAILAGRLHASELPAHQAALAPEERGLVDEIHRLATSRERALERQRLQHRYASVLQFWRWLHIPLTILFVPAVLLHVVFALDLPAKVLPREATPPTWSGFETSVTCEPCHKAIYDQWKASMHAHAMKSPVMIAQTNQLIRAELGATKAPDPRGICVNCHGPAGVLLTQGVTLPLSHPMGGDELVNEGISCSVCHQHQGKPTPGQGGVSLYQHSLARGSTFFGPIRDPVGNAHHASEFDPVYRNPDDLCVGCHNVSYDKNGDGKVVKGQDLVLQVTDEEYQDYRAAGGAQTCTSCHMPRLQTTRAAESASIPFEQDREAPRREVHDHAFVGVDYPLDTVATRDPERPLREALLRSAAAVDLPRSSIAVRAGALSFDATVTNSGAGHNVPTGFAFARQMWLEVTVGDPTGPIFTSGVLANSAADLCDSSTLDEPNSPMRAYVKGCDRSDLSLVNFQRKLVNHFEIAKDKDGHALVNDRGDPKLIQAENGQEDWLQHLSAGVVDRVRPSDHQPLAALRPNETRTLHYIAALPARPLGDITISVRLLFRSSPPYMLRAMADHQPPAERPRLGPLIGGLQVVEMATIRQRVGPRGI